MEITAVQALLIALWVALVQSRGIGYATLTLRFSPLMTGLVCGIVLNDIQGAMIITAAIQLMYMGIFAPGGGMPSEPAVATAIAVPTALASGMTPEQAVVIAVPVGLLGGYLYQFRFFINTFIIKLTDKYAEELNDKGLFLSIIVLPILVAFVIYVPTMYLTLMMGVDWVVELTKSQGGGILFKALSVVGAGLSSIGIALTLHVIGKKSYLVFFFLAYYMAIILKPLGVTTVTYAIIGTLIAAIFILAQNKDEFN